MELHSHSHNLNRQKRSLILSIILNLIFAIGELIAGLFANSLTLISGSLHDLSDSFALTLSYFGLRVAQLSPNRRRTFGYKKIRILTAFLNAFVLAVFTVIVLRAVVLRIIHPEQVKSSVLWVIAIIGIIVNGTAVFQLYRDRASISIRTAMLHLVDDFLGWIAILAGGLIIQFTKWYVIDPILSIGVSAFVIYGAYKILRESASILIDSTPRDISFEAVRKFVLDFDKRVIDLHDLHIWTIGEGERALMAHIVVNDNPISSYHQLLSNLECALIQNFQITHVTLELECDKCKSGENVCNP
jgi:cobalt-zinc-cadmium efflux system protein